jgi:hypothetical protein
VVFLFSFLHCAVVFFITLTFCGVFAFIPTLFCPKQCRNHAKHNTM